MASIAGAVAFLISHMYLDLNLTMYICFGTTLVIRLISIKFNWHLAKVKTGVLIDETQENEHDSPE